MSDEDESVNALSCKVVLIGESGVGKTSIISRYINNSFSNIMMTTAGANYATKTTFIEDAKQYINFEIWDTAGQEKFRALTKIFYKNASVIVLVYDITRKESFVQLKEFWVKEIQSNATNVNNKFIFALAGNKSDMYEEEKVKDKEAQAFAKEIDAIYKPTSAKVGSGIDDLFILIGQKLINPEYQDLGSMTKEERKQYNNNQQIKSLKDTKKEDSAKKGCC